MSCADVNFTRNQRHLDINIYLSILWSDLSKTTTKACHDSIDEVYLSSTLCKIRPHLFLNFLYNLPFFIKLLSKHCVCNLKPFIFLDIS